MSIYDSIAAGKYENKMPLSSSDDEEIIDRENMTGKQVREAKERNRDRRHKTRVAYATESARLDALFKSDLEVEYGLAGHSKADKVWGLAWERGHSNGHHAVAQHYEELAELVKA